MKIKTLFLFVVAIVLLTITVYAHKGNVDDDGGHYNRSTDEYHFHHGQPPHQHPNNTCEYNFEWGPDTSTGSSANSNVSSSPRYTASDIELFTDTSEVDLEPPQKKQNILVMIFAFLCLYTLVFLLPCMFGLFIVVTIIDKIFKMKTSDCFNHKPLWVFAFVFFMPFILSKTFDFKYEKHLIVIDIVLFIGMIIYYRFKDNKLSKAKENATYAQVPPAPPVMSTANLVKLSDIFNRSEVLRAEYFSQQTYLTKISERNIASDFENGKIDKLKATELIHEISSAQAKLNEILEEFNHTVELHTELVAEIERETSSAAQASPTPVVTTVKAATPPMQYEGKPVKTRHCKYCVGLLPQDSGKCFDCGKNNFRFIPPKLTTSSVLAVVLAIGLTLVCVASYHQSVKIAELSGVIAKNNEIIEKNQSTILKLNEDLLSSENRQNILANRLIDARTSTSNYVKSAAKYLEKANFLDYNIALTLATGQKYHTLDCQYIQQVETFWVYAIGDAESMGYTPCALCH